MCMMLLGEQARFCFYFSCESLWLQSISIRKDHTLCEHKSREAFTSFSPGRANTSPNFQKKGAESMKAGTERRDRNTLMQGCLSRESPFWSLHIRLLVDVQECAAECPVQTSGALFPWVVWRSALLKSSDFLIRWRTRISCYLSIIS